MNMIHRDEQYKLLYHALMEAFSGPSRCMATEKFVEAYQEQTCHANCRDVVQNISQSSEFEELQSLRKEYTQQDHISGRAQIPAYYTQSVLPVEKSMCCLFYIKGYNSYYNAVLIQVKRKRNMPCHYQICYHANRNFSFKSFIKHDNMNQTLINICVSETIVIYIIHVFCIRLRYRP